MSRRLDDERGIALVVVMLVMMVLVSLSVAVVQMSVESGKLAGYDQRRIESVQAGETGLARFRAVLPASVGTNSSGQYKICALQGQTLTVPNPLSTYTLDIELYTGPDAGGAKIGCTDPVYDGRTDIESAMITATATSGRTTTNTFSSRRTIQELINLSPVYGDGVTSAIYGARRIVIDNNVNINYHETTNDADIYSRGDVIVNNYLDLQGSVYALGDVEVAGCIEGNIYVKGDVTLSAPVAYVGACTSSSPGQPGGEAATGRIIYPGFGYVTSSTGSITIPTGGDAYGTCTAASGGSPIVDGRCSEYRDPNNNDVPATCGDAVAEPLEPCGYVQGSDDPPNIDFPVMDYDPANWTDLGYTIHSYNDCTTARTALTTYLTAGTPVGWSSTAGDHVISLFQKATNAAGCPMTLAAGNYTLPGNLGLIVNGSFEMTGQVSVANSGSDTHTFFVIRPTNGTPAMDTQALRDANCGSDPGVTSPNANTPASLTAAAGWPYDQRYSTKTDLSTINYLSYTPCNIRTYNTNKSGQGQFIAGETVYINNSFSLSFLPIDLPDVQPVGYSAAPVFLREIGS